jgi:hypothetical protein
MVEVPTGVPGWGIELPLISAGVSWLANPKFSEPPGCISVAALFAVNSMAYPPDESTGVRVSLQPLGGVTEIGLVARKFSPGTHAYQNVPMVSFELVSVRLIV